MKFQDNLKRLRTEKGITQQKLADAIHVSRTLITKYESGTARPSKENIEKLSQYLGVSQEELLGKEDTIAMTLESAQKWSTLRLVYRIVALLLPIVLLLVLTLPIVRVAYYGQCSPCHQGENCTCPLLYAYIAFLSSNGSLWALYPLTITVAVFSCISVILMAVVFLPIKDRAKSILSNINIALFILEFLALLFLLHFVAVSNVTDFFANVYDY